MSEVYIYGVDGKRVPEPPKQPAPCPADQHCWHLRPEQHTIGNHSDWLCCLCGKLHCVYAKAHLTSHGPWAGELAEKGCGVTLGPMVLP